VAARDAVLLKPGSLTPKEWLEDAFDAITADRPYPSVLSFDKAIGVLRERLSGDTEDGRDTTV